VFAKRAQAESREVILHMPMESLGRRKQERDLLLSTMSPEEIVHTLDQALQTVPYAIGINNHMGSRLTQLSLPMSVTMQYLSKKGLLFVDSRTTRFSKAQEIATQLGVVNTKRNVFLDHDLSPEKIDSEFHRLIRLGKKYGYAVGIAHPHKQSLTYLQHHIRSLTDHNVKLVTLSEALHKRTQLAFSQREAAKQQLGLQDQDIQ
jgi:polysaccharide deacetylase 2 family uncharacterized protein YibQ